MNELYILFFNKFNTNLKDYNRRVKVLIKQLKSSSKKAFIFKFIGVCSYIFFVTTILFVFSYLTMYFYGFNIEILLIFSIIFLSFLVITKYIEDRLLIKIKNSDYIDSILKLRIESMNTFFSTNFSTYPVLDQVNFFLKQNELIKQDKKDTWLFLKNFLISGIILSLLVTIFNFLFDISNINQNLFLFFIYAIAFCLFIYAVANLVFNISYSKYQKIENALLEYKYFYMLRKR